MLLEKELGGPGHETVTTVAFGSSNVMVNDVIMAVNNLDARSEPFQAVIEKIKTAEQKVICIRFVRPVLPTSKSPKPRPVIAI